MSEEPKKRLVFGQDLPETEEKPKEREPMDGH
jgi:hypothetical protein